MGNTENQLDQRILSIKNETKKQLEKIAKDAFDSVRRNKKQDVFEDIKERGNQLANSLDKVTKSLVDHANKVISSFEKEITADKDKDKYVEKLKSQLTEECRKLVLATKDNAIKRFKA
jgi:hypothetical protein